MPVVSYARIEKGRGEDIMKHFVYSLISVLCILSIYLIAYFVSDRDLCQCLCGIALGVCITCLIHFFIIEEAEK